VSIAHSIFDTWDFGMRCLALSFLVCCAAAEPARVVVVGSADTYDAKGRPSFYLAVKTYTDATRLSRPD